MDDPSQEPANPTPPTTAGPVSRGSSDDEQHVRLLATFYFVLGGLTGLFSFCPVIHLSIGIMMLVNPEAMGSGPNPPPPEMLTFMGVMFTVFPALIMLFGWTLAGLQLYAGTCLLKHRRHTMCTVVAALTCLSIPFGTVLGVFTLIVLMRPTVKPMFDGPR